MKSLPENTTNQFHLVATCTLTTVITAKHYYKTNSDILNIYEKYDSNNTHYYVSQCCKEKTEIKAEKLAKICKDLILKKKPSVSSNLHNFNIKDALGVETKNITNLQSSSFAFEFNMIKLSLGEKIATFHYPEEENELSKNRINGIYKKPSKKDGKPIYTILNSNKITKCNGEKELVQNLQPQKTGFLNNLAGMQKALLQGITGIEVNKESLDVMPILQQTIKKNKSITFIQSPSY